MLWESRKANQLLYEKLLNPQGRTGVLEKCQYHSITCAETVCVRVCAHMRCLSVQNIQYEVFECLPPFDWPNSISFTVNRIMKIMELKVNPI